jgi:hypothetical protein
MLKMTYKLWCSSFQMCHVNININASCSRTLKEIILRMRLEGNHTMVKPFVSCLILQLSFNDFHRWESSLHRHYRKRLNFRGPKTHENKPKPTKIAYFRRPKISSTKIGNYFRRYRRKRLIFVGFPKADENSWSADYFRRPLRPTKIGT